MTLRGRRRARADLESRADALMRRARRGLSADAYRGMVQLIRDGLEGRCHRRLSQDGVVNLVCREMPDDDLSAHFVCYFALAELWSAPAEQLGSPQRPTTPDASDGVDRRQRHRGFGVDAVQEARAAVVD